MSYPIVMFILLTVIIRQSNCNSIRKQDPYTAYLHSYTNQFKNNVRNQDNGYNVLTSDTDLRNYEAGDNVDLILPSDLQFVPRRNDRIEKLELSYRYPKSIEVNQSITEEASDNKTKAEEIVLLIETTKQPLPKSTTAKPKKVTQKRNKPPRTDTRISNKNQIMDNDDVVIDEGEMNPVVPHRPHNNNMAGQSQIGNRESQMVIKPTVIVNFRGSVSNRDSEIRLEGRNNEDNSTAIPSSPQNVFNINQEVNIERTHAILDEDEEEQLKKLNNKKNGLKIDVQSREFEIDLDERERKSLKENLTIVFDLQNPERNRVVTYLLK